MLITTPRENNCHETGSKKDNQTINKQEPPTENKPLEFELQNIRFDHPYLQERGIDPGLAEKFGVGYFSGRGSMNGRTVVLVEGFFGCIKVY